MKKITFLCFLILFSIRVNAQINGGLDLTFNPVDIGIAFRGNSTIKFQVDGKMLFAVGQSIIYKNTLKYGVIRVNPDGSIDNTFNFIFPSTSISNTVSNIYIQSDGKILVTGYIIINNIGYKVIRINSNGSIDSSFALPLEKNNNGSSPLIIFKPDGKIIVSYIISGGLYDTTNVEIFNADGSKDTSFNYYGGYLSALALQPDGKLIIAGHFDSYNNVPINNIARLNENGTLDTTFNPVVGSASIINSVVLQPDGKIILGFINNSLNPYQSLIRLNTDGSLDNSFNITTDRNSYSTMAVALQTDGKILIGGYFTKVNGVSMNRIARLKADGTLDSSFSTGTGPVGDENCKIYKIIVQPNGKILVGGQFSSFNNFSINSFVGLNSDGSIDFDFIPGTDSAANDRVTSMSLQPNGKILIGGDFNFYYGVSRTHLARINADGSLDYNFNSVLKEEEMVRSIVLQPDGKIIIRCDLPRLPYFNAPPRGRILRLNADGSVDSTFNPVIGIDDYISSLAIQSDGKLIIGGGEFIDANNVRVSKIFRLNPDGSIDPTFNFTSGADYIAKLLVQKDGKIIIGRNWQFLNNRTSDVARLNSDGSVDPTFISGSGVNYNIMDMVIQPDDKIVIGGNFSTYNGVSVKSMVRLNTNGSIDPTFNSVLINDGVVSSDGNNNASIRCIILLSNSKMLVSGGLRQYYNSHNWWLESLALVNSDGSLNVDFNIGQLQFGNFAFAGVLQPDGKVVIGGSFYKYNNTLRTCIARIDLFKASTNFELKVTDPTCQTKTNGKLNITAIEPYDYTATMDGNEFSFTNNTLNIENLAPKTYSICIKVPALNNRTQCFEFTVKAVPGLSGKTAMDTQGNKTMANVTIESGTAPYTIEVNGKTVEITLQNQFSIPVQNGDLLVVKTSLPCEGTISEKVSLLNVLTAYPNPTSEFVELFIPNTFQKNHIKVQVIDNIGKIVINKEFKITDNYIQIPMEQLSPGLYIIQLLLDKPQTIKVIKK